jgi:hypothetical protein
LLTGAEFQAPHQPFACSYHLSGLIVHRLHTSLCHELLLLLLLLLLVLLLGLLLLPMLLLVLPPLFQAQRHRPARNQQVHGPQHAQRGLLICHSQRFHQPLRVARQQLLASFLAESGAVQREGRPGAGEASLAARYKWREGLRLATGICWRKLAGMCGLSTTTGGFS